MDSAILAAIIAAIVTLISVAIRLVAALRSAQIAAREAHKDTAATLNQQREALGKTLEEQRLRTLNDRFATAAAQLGGDKPPAVPLAGVFAMAGLPNDWAKNRQTCVDVLCGYLRMPHERHTGRPVPQPEQLAFQASREVRHTVIRVVAAHLRDDAAVSWQGLNFDFTEVVFDGGDFHGVKFSGGRVNFDHAEFSGDKLDFGDAEFSGGRVTFGVARFSGGEVSFRGAKFSGGEVTFGDSKFSGGRLTFDGAKFSDGAVHFGGAEFSGSILTFDGADFSSGGVRFGGNKFCGGTVDFTGAGDWSFPPAFPWTDTPPPIVKLPRKEDQAQA